MKRYEFWFKENFTYSGKWSAYFGYCDAEDENEAIEIADKYMDGKMSLWDEIGCKSDIVLVGVKECCGPLFNVVEKYARRLVRKEAVVDEGF